ncbi:hypothetical protein JOB18_002334 [Solea senegalensis]|uniref:Uncharacterized protein n=1 Tax=Solea senegalensis TaxID=28829 RepID=A0AAV6SVS4_SOLSE|nr:hypothetical protein JOB18_002334 [Solea senegalensis]
MMKNALTHTLNRFELLSVGRCSTPPVWDPFLQGRHFLTCQAKDGKELLGFHSPHIDQVHHIRRTFYPKSLIIVFQWSALAFDMQTPKTLAA